MVHKNKIIALGALLLLALMLVLLHHSFICWGMRWYLNAQLSQKGEIDFAYQNLSFKEGRCVLHNVSIEYKGREENSMFCVQADTVQIFFAFQFVPFICKPKIVVHHPKITVMTKDMQKTSQETALVHPLDTYLFKLPVTVFQGELSFEGEVIFVDFESLENGKSRRIRVCKERGDPPIFSAIFSKQDLGMCVTVHCNKLDMAWALKAGRFFSPVFLKGLHVKNGTITGELALALSDKNSVQHVQYSLNIDDFVSYHEKYNLHMHVCHLMWEENFVPEMGEPNVLNRVFSRILGCSEFREGQVAEGSLERIPWMITDIKGKLSFSNQNKPFVCLHGIFHQEEGGYPFQLVGKKIVEDTFWTIDVDINLTDEERTRTYCKISSKEDHCYLVQVDFSYVNAKLFTLFHHFISSHFPKIGSIQIEEGVFSGKMQGWVKENRITKCEVTHFLFENVKAQFSDAKLVWNAQKMQGKGEFDLSTSNFFDGAFWEMNVENGRAFLNDKTTVEHLDFHIAMHDYYVKPSQLTLFLHGIKGVLNFEGLYTHLNLHAGLTWTPKEMAHILEMKESAELQDVITLDLNAHVKTWKEKTNIEGFLSILYEDALEDVMQFGGEWDLHKLLTNGTKEGLCSGWFRAKDLSDHTLNLPLIFLQQSWRGAGKADIEGRVTPQSVECIIDPTHLCYISSAIDLEPNGRDQLPSCTLIFDFQTKTWRGNISLKDVKLKEHSFGITFDSFNSEVDLVQTKLLFHHVHAMVHGISFRGEMVLDYQWEDRNELTINTHHINGEAKDVFSFLRHFTPFATIDCPLEGMISSGPGEMYLRAYIGDVEELLEWKIALHLHKGRYPLSQALSLEDVTGDLHYCKEEGVFMLQNSTGNLLLSKGDSPKSYALKAPFVKFDLASATWHYDVRLEAPTYEVCKIVGTALKKEGEFQCMFDHEQTCFFGTKIDLSLLSISEKGVLNTMHAHATLSALDLFHHIDFLSSAGIIPIKPLDINEMRAPKHEGATSISFDFDRQNQTFDFKAKSAHLLCGPMHVDRLAIHVERRGDHVVVDQCKIGAFAMKANIDKGQDGWSILQFELNWKGCHVQSNSGLYHEGNQKLELFLATLQIDLQDIATLFPSSEIDWNYITGTLNGKGKIACDFSQGLKNPSFFSEICFTGENLGKGNLLLDTPNALHFFFNFEQGLQIKGGNVHLSHLQFDELWAKCCFDTLSYHNHTWQGKNFTFTVPPELVHFLGKTDTLPYLSYKEGELLLFQHPLRWDNQIEATIHFTIEKDLCAWGRLKEGYYWIGGKAWYLNDFSYTYEKSTFNLMLNTLFEEKPFDLKMQLFCRPHFMSKICIQERECKEGETGHGLEIQTDWNEHEGYYIRNIIGQICGLDFDFHHNPKKSLYDQLVLTGQLKMNISVLTPLLPSKIQDIVREFSFGKGYELSGDLVLPKVQSKDSFFIGYLKGKNFQLIGSVIETLMSEIVIHRDHIELTNFNISDASGIFKMDTIRICQEQDQKWQLSIPKISIQDFRPSLLKKIGKCPGSMKPFMIRSLYCHNIHGYLEDSNSFTGGGNLHFTNTFKREYNFFDIPLEILGILGLDMGLLVPICGELNFNIVDGRVYLKELKESYSEGLRSQFFLSPTYLSYIDFDGNLNINIKMKQSVLLKITESFTLTIAGTFEKPKYALK